MSLENSFKVPRPKPEQAANDVLFDKSTLTELLQNIRPILQGSESIKDRDPSTASFAGAVVTRELNTNPQRVLEIATDIKLAIETIAYISRFANAPTLAEALETGVCRAQEQKDINRSIADIRRFLPKYVKRMQELIRYREDDRFIELFAAFEAAVAKAREDLASIERRLSGLDVRG